MITRLEIIFQRKYMEIRFDVEKNWNLVTY